MSTLTEPIAPNTHGPWAFLDWARHMYRRSSGLGVTDLLRRPPAPLVPVALSSPVVEEAARRALIEQLDRCGVAHFLLTTPPSRSPGYLDEIAASAADLFPTAQEGPRPACTVLIGLESEPLSGGFTCFTNLLVVAMALAHSDPHAYESLFLPDALTVEHRSPERAHRRTAPVLALDDHHQPRVFYRVPGRDLVVRWRPDPALARARYVLETLTAPFAPGSVIVHLTRPGEGVIVRDAHVVHQHTHHVDDETHRRVLTYRWYTGRRVPTPVVPKPRAASEPLLPQPVDSA